MSVLELVLMKHVPCMLSHVPWGRCPEGCQRSHGHPRNEVHHPGCRLVADRVASVSLCLPGETWQREPSRVHDQKLAF